MLFLQAHITGEQSVPMQGQDLLWISLPLSLQMVRKGTHFVLIILLFVDSNLSKHYSSSMANTDGELRLGGFKDSSCLHRIHVSLFGLSLCRVHHLLVFQT